MIHDASLGRGNVDHIVIGPPGVFTIETKSHPGPVRVGRVHGATLAQAQAQGKAIGWVTGHRGRAADRLQPRLGRPPRRAAQGRAGAARADAARATSNAAQMRFSASDVDQAHRLLAEALLEHHGRTRLLGDRWSIRL